MPQARYHDANNSPLNKYGNGPFCKFSIPCNACGEGVYALFVNDTLKYVGECEDLVNRFNMGYGNISPKNCYQGGQPTNCRINHLILECFQEGSRIGLFFLPTRERHNVEYALIKEFSPEWNKSQGRLYPASSPRKYSLKGDTSKVGRSKYCA